MGNGIARIVETSTKVSMKILCLESMWDLEDYMTVKPILEMINQNYGIEFVHEKFYSFDELKKKIKKHRDKDFDVIYLAAHGRPGLIKNGTDYNDTISIEEFFEYFGDAVKNKVVHISACATLDIDDDRLKELLSRYGCKILSGYTTFTYWLPSASMDIIYFDNLVSDGLDTEKSVYDFIRINRSLVEFSGFKIRLNNGELSG